MFRNRLAREESCRRKEEVFMAELTTTSHAILGLLARRDCTTYELAQQMRRKLHHVWPRAERKLYEEPRRLVEAGYATSVKDMIGRRARTIYSITPAGRGALKEWLRSPIDVPSFEFEGMVRVLFSDQSDTNSLRETLERIKTQAEEERRHFELVAEAADRKNGDTFIGNGPDRHAIDALSRRFMVEHYEHMGEWARWALSEVDRWNEPSSESSTGTSNGDPESDHSRPESSMDVVSIDE
jgi:PadR family transcriptional regulator AphA